MTHSYVRHVSFICDLTCSYAWQDPFECVMAHLLCVTRLIRCVTWFNHMCRAFCTHPHLAHIHNLLRLLLLQHYLRKKSWMYAVIMFVFRNIHIWTCDIHNAYYIQIHIRCIEIMFIFKSRCACCCGGGACARTGRFTYMYECTYMHE